MFAVTSEYLVVQVGCDGNNVISGASTRGWSACSTAGWSACSALLLSLLALVHLSVFAL